MSQHTPYFNFLQKPPKLHNEFTADTFLQDYLKTFLPEKMLQEIKTDLEQFGKKVATTYVEWAREAETNPPQLTQFNAWGKRVDEITVSQAWKNFDKVAAEEGLVAIGYERKYAEHSRLYQFTKLYLFTASSAIYTCPLAMSDGAARLIEIYGNDFLKNTAYQGLTSRVPSEFKTSGQWMTERTGGSDVSRSMTLATPDGDDYVLHGHKWFTSAITADMAFTLASTEQPEKGKRAPLSLFYMSIKNEDGSLNGIEVEALKDKLGTKALPTAQLLLTGAKAKLVGEKGKGVRTIATLFNITRIYNTVSALSYMRRAYSLCKAYATEREAFGQPIANHLLYKKNLRELEITYQSNALLTFFMTRILGKEETNMATESEKALLRLLTPVAKLFTAKHAIASASEHIEMFGGLGYLEDSGIPSMLRDAQVLSIWEGTTNVLSLDMLRAIEKENGWTAFVEFARETLNETTHPDLKQQKEMVSNKFKTLSDFMKSQTSQDAIVSASRDVAFYLAELSIALLWLNFLNTNLSNENYFQAFGYWLKYKMNESLLHSSEVLGLNGKKVPAAV